MKTVVIYHRADFDGIFCREIARKFLGEDGVTYIGWDYGDPVPTPEAVSAEDRLYMLDISIEGLMEHPHLTWIDHHKSAMEKYLDRGRQFRTGRIPYCIDGVAACRLAWQFFTGMPGLRDESVLPPKQEYVERIVREPYAVQLAGEYDIWDRRNPDAEVFQFGLRSVDLTDHCWSQLLSVNRTAAVADVEELVEAGYTDLLQPDGTMRPAIIHTMLQNGRLLQRYQQETDAGVVKYRSYVAEFEGLKFLCLNTARCNSLTFAARDVPETGHDALMGFYWTGTEWSVSLYHARHRTDLDLSTIAVRHGGGGHRGACGFRRSFGKPNEPTLPFESDQLHIMQLAAISTLKGAPPKLIQ